MRTRACLQICAVLLALASPARSATTALTSPNDFGPSLVIDFEGPAHGTAANTLYAAQGVEFRYDLAGSTVPIFDWTAAGRQTTSPTNVIATVLGLNGSQYSDFLDLVFDTPRLEVGAFFGNDQGIASVLTILTVYDANDLPLGFTTVQNNQNTSVDQFIGIRSDTPFARARFEYVTLAGDLSVVLDDVIFSVIPEPGTGLLVAFGLLALARRRR